MPLRAADITSTRRFEDGEDWIELRTELTKGEADSVQDLTRAYRIDPANAESGVELESRVGEANKALFSILVVGWSLPVAPTVEGYTSLDGQSGDWVDECINEVLLERNKSAEKKPSSSRKPRKPVSS